MKDTKFNCACPHCGKRTLISIKFQFDIPKTYNATCKCDKCGKQVDIEISLALPVYPHSNQ